MKPTLAIYIEVAKRQQGMSRKELRQTFKEKNLWTILSSMVRYGYLDRAGETYTQKRAPAGLTIDLMREILDARG